MGEGLQVSTIHVQKVGENEKDKNKEVEGEGGGEKEKEKIHPTLISEERCYKKSMELDTFGFIAILFFL